MTELSFLLDLFLNHKLSAKTKAHVAERLNELAQRINPPVTQAQSVLVGGVPQAPSTAALMQKHGLSPVAVEPVQPVNVAVTPATQAALESRKIALANAQTGKVEPGRTSPRKF